MLKVGLIDVGTGNIGSLFGILKKIQKKKSYYLTKTNDPNKIKNLDKIILPGQGAFKELMQALSKHKIRNKITEHIKNKKPYLGICVGMQILATVGHETRATKGLNIIKGEVKKFKNTSIRIPHMGWNNIELKKKSSLVNSPIQEKDFYFVHSFMMTDIDRKNILSQTLYGQKFCSSVQMENCYGVQFHPEKSGKQGEKLLENFIFRC